MKRLIFFCAPFICLMGNSQPWITSDNYDQAINRADSFFAAMIVDTSAFDIEEENGWYSNFTRWNEFYKHRLDTNSEMVGYIQAKARDLSIPVVKSGGSQDMWSCLGPFYSTEPGNMKAHQGWVNSIYVIPNNINPNLPTIFAGSNAGGLFRSIDGGLNWEPLTDNVPGPVGINDIAVDNANPDLIYIATSLKIFEYGIGILKTSDGGQTWSNTTPF